MSNFLQLSGSETRTQSVPSVCTCGCKEFYQQADFKRSVGVGLMAFASLLTCVLLYMNFGWWTVWSPMFALLGIDFVLRKTTSTAIICYRCGMIYRGVEKSLSFDVPGFDLEVFDRIQYQQQTSADV
jgi:hypothetical protein